MNKTLASLQALINSQDLADDVRKGGEGNVAAQTRARKAMQNVKDLAQKLREEILAARKK